MAMRHDGMTRRVILKASVAMAATAVLAACGGAAPTATPSNGAAGGVGTATMSGTAKKGGTLKLSQPIPITPFEFQQLGPHIALVALGVFDTLIRYDDKNQPQPRLAESWTWNADKTELTLKLRSGVKFHTGRDFTSDDVKFNLERIRDAKVASQLAGQSKTITDIATPNPGTTVLTFAQPNLAIFDALNLLVILDKATAANLEGAKQVIGTGPFKWKDYAPGSKLTLVRNDQYWESGKPYLDGIDLEITDDKQSMVVGVESGQRDVAWQLLTQDLSRLKSSPQVAPIISDKGAQFYYIGVNTAADGVQDKRVRQAFNASIDRKRITDTLLFGLVEPDTLMWPKASPAYNAEIASTVKFDTAAAKKLFTDAGVASGTTFIIEVNAQDPINGKIAQILQADLQSIDIKLDIQTIENSVFQKKLAEASFKQLFGNTMGFMNFNPGAFFVTAYPVRTPDNTAKFNPPEYADLIKKMQTEADPTKLKGYYDQMDKLLVDESFNMPTSQAPQGWALQKSVKGWAYNTFNFVQLGEVWLDR